ncbi:fructose-specific PTS transporter subunit EIIC [Aquibacillus koreensis]|uniref:Fructose-specific PTS transporter subunit EIIC n=1 Tax=Aquibacillus koreensis TaxID=279446 RepID=A0A9X3WKR6_9BACI|nr:fructose-specific PTS transporter subunit EIIC [Aquibacillus koreensis]MCT2536024.1 fructose-specific PTS transporter subunit EIIC [Aquibacillus koreensis]MDC3420480.1 fructose-specific PTS transporter subunit EIIC [Aquibacillus koreensis]
MNITDLLRKDTIILDLQANSKASVIDELVNKLDKAGRLSDKDAFKQAILAREEQSTTGIGDGIAIPHAKTAAVKTPAIVFGRSIEGIDYEALDGQPSHLFFMIAASEGANQTHLQTLSRLSSFLMDDNFRKNIEAATSEDEVLEVINVKEREEEEETEQTEEQAESFILAVTGCPTGIAHTYMAADKLKATAKEMGVGIKVETNGSSGVKNRLTPEEIEKADAIIIAADTKIETERFKGKPVIQVPVAKGIHEPKELIERAIKKDAPIHQGGGNESSDDGSEENGKSGFYKHLMNGVSNMLPFVVGGGILIAIAFLFGGIEPQNPDSDRYHPLWDMLMTIGGGNAFHLMVPVLAGFIASSIADRPGFAPGMIGGLIAITSGIEGADGGSGFLGGLIAGFLAGYVTLGVKKALEVLPSVFDGLKTVLFYPVFSIGIAGLIMLLINPPLTTLYTGLSSWLQGLGDTNLVLLGIILGGMMAVDMGGPINKAAYTFGIAMLDAGNYNFIAAIMAGGMVPPLATAIASTIFKNKFTRQERDAGKSNYALGAFFISEGAIPFAAADPARVIPPIIVGSAVAGGLSMLFDIGLQAPHGGIVVIGLVEGSPILYLLSIIVGSLVGAFLLGFLKKPIIKE